MEPLNEEKHLLAFVIDNEVDLLSIHFDLAGLDYIMSQLGHIRKRLVANEAGHTHFFSEDWGDGGLSISTRGEGEGDGRPIHQINAYGVTDDWVDKLGFNRS